MVNRHFQWQACLWFCWPDGVGRRLPGLTSINAPARTARSRFRMCRVRARSGCWTSRWLRLGRKHPLPAPAQTVKAPSLPATPGMPAADSALQAMTGAMQQRMLVAEGLTVASSVKVQVAEYYMTEGKLPSSNAMLGLPPAKEYVRNAMIGLEVQADGVDCGEVQREVRGEERRTAAEARCVEDAHGDGVVVLVTQLQGYCHLGAGCRYTGRGK
jgi:hypothetical protein